MSKKLFYSALLFGTFFACGELRDTHRSIEEIYGNSGEEVSVSAPIEYRNTASEDYNLPTADSGAISIAELIALYPADSDSTIFVGEGEHFTDIGESSDRDISYQGCWSGSEEVIAELPVVIEGVVSLHPRQFVKVDICGQDERHYGSFVVEDDTGGILVLRDSRVANYNYGDRVRVTVYGMMLTFGRDSDTRAVLISDVEFAPQAFREVISEADPCESNADCVSNQCEQNENGKFCRIREIDRVVLYEETEEAFSADFMIANASKTYRIEGYVSQIPTNENFSQMIVTSELFEPIFTGRLEGPLLQCVRTCESACQSNCPSSNVCADACLSMCEEENVTSIPDSEIPSCWVVGLDVELGRRNFQPQYGQHIQVTGPVVNSYDRQILIGSTGQITFLDQE